MHLPFIHNHPFSTFVGWAAHEQATRYRAHDACVQPPAWHTMQACPSVINVLMQGNSHKQQIQGWATTHDLWQGI